MAVLHVRHSVTLILILGSNPDITKIPPPLLFHAARAWARAWEGAGWERGDGGARVCGLGVESIEDVPIIHLYVSL